jgi:hypothetical protein
MNTNEAIAAAENRKVHLTNLMVQQKCEVPKKIELNESRK